MRMNPTNTALANELRRVVQQRTQQIDDGEAVAAILLWSFIEDHASAHGRPVAQLARDQWIAFVEYAQKNLSVARAAGVPVDRHQGISPTDADVKAHAGDAPTAGKE
jgi:hypothetical protein